MQHHETCMFVYVPLTNTSTIVGDITGYSWDNQITDSGRAHAQFKMYLSQLNALSEIDVHVYWLVGCRKF